MWGAELVLPSLSSIVMPIIYGAITGAVAYGGYKAVEALNNMGTATNADSVVQAYINYYIARQAALKEERNKQLKEEKKKKEKNIEEVQDKIEEYLGDDFLFNSQTIKVSMKAAVK